MNSKIPLILSLAANIVLTFSFVFFLNDWSEKETQLVYHMTTVSICPAGTRLVTNAPPVATAVALDKNSASR